MYDNGIAWMIAAGPRDDVESAASLRNAEHLRAFRAARGASPSPLQRIAGWLATLVRREDARPSDLACCPG